MRRTVSTLFFLAVGFALGWFLCDYWSEERYASRKAQRSASFRRHPVSLLSDRVNL